jgi:hypothetical protein
VITVINEEGSVDRIYELDGLGRLKDRIAPQARRTLRHVTRARIAERQAAVTEPELAIKQTDIPNEHINLAAEATRAIPPLETGVVASECCSSTPDWETLDWDISLFATPLPPPVSSEFDLEFFN